jgi:hypothetical protein
MTVCKTNNIFWTDEDIMIFWDKSHNSKYYEDNYQA